LYIQLKKKILQNKCFSITIRTAVVCELNLATIQITVNLLYIFHKHHTNYTFSIVNSIKDIFSKISVVVIIRTAVMCKLNFGNIQ